MMQKTTSSQIIDHIQKNQTASVRELSLKLGVTRANITYHLRQLRRKGMVEPLPPRKKAGRGRAEQRFQLASSMRANNYLALCETLLGLINERETGREVDFNIIGERLAEQVNLAPGLPAQRLNRLCAHLNRHGYQASWVAHRNGPQIIFKSCPYAALINSYPGLCQMDRNLICTALKGDAKKVETIDFSHGISGACRFELSKEYP